MKKLLMAVLILMGICFSSNWHIPQQVASLQNLKAIVPSDNGVINSSILWTGTAGTVNVIAEGDQTNTTVSITVVAGSVFPVTVKKVHATGTTATRIIGMW